MNASIRSIALLRGINVGGNTLVRMAPLKSLFEEMGLTEVETVLQSGNVVFSGGGARCGAEAIQKRIHREFGLDVHVQLLTARELKAAVDRNPFKGSKLSASKIAICFLSALPTQSGLRKLAAIESGEDEFKCQGRTLYLHCPGGFGRTKLSLAAIERCLGVKGTSRNWNTILKLLDLTSGGGKSS